MKSTEVQDQAATLAKLGLAPEGALFVDHGRTVGVLAGKWGAFAGWVDVAWRDYDGPAPYLRDVVHVPFSDVDDVVGAASARTKRSAKLGRLHSIDDWDVCHGCAERHLVWCIDLRKRLPRPERCSAPLSALSWSRPARVSAREVRLQG
jgi:hypothetical protein